MAFHAEHFEVIVFELKPGEVEFGERSLTLKSGRLRGLLRTQTPSVNRKKRSHVHGEDMALYYSI